MSIPALPRKMSCHGRTEKGSPLGAKWTNVAITDFPGAHGLAGAQCPADPPHGPDKGTNGLRAQSAELTGPPRARARRVYHHSCPRTPIHSFIQNAVKYTVLDVEYGAQKATWKKSLQNHEQKATPSTSFIDTAF